MEHDHPDDNQEEISFLVDGDGVAMEPGDALRLSPGVTRKIENGDTEGTFVLAGAP